MHKHVKQILFFGIVGGTTFLIDLSVTLFLNKVLGLPPYLASGIGFFSSFFFSFPMNKSKVFKHSADDRFSLKTQVFFYLLLSVVNLCITSLLVQLLTVHVGIEIAISKILVTGLIAVWNFLIFKLFVFSKAKEKPGTEFN